MGDHPAEWYESRGPLARAVVEEIEEAIGAVENGEIVGQITTNSEEINLIDWNSKHFKTR